MSPTEHDLRAALRTGEGDRPDIDRLVAVGRARQAQSRMHLLATAAIVLVVAGAGTGGALLWGGGSSGRTAAAARGDSFAGPAGGSALGGAAPRPHSYAAEGRKAQANAPASPAAVACPATQPHYALPGGGSPGQFGADGALFSRTVSAIIVCSYGTPELAAQHVAAPARLVLTGGRATELATSLEHASTARTPRACPNIATSTPRALAILGIAADGHTVGTITTTLVVPACNVQVSNGTAVRYQWAPPQDLQTVLSTLTPTFGGSALPVPNRTPSGQIHPSPIKT